MSKVEYSIIYHSNCKDGELSAFIVAQYAKAYGRTYELIPMHYGNPLPVCNGDIIYVVDFSFKLAELRELQQGTKNLVMYDHHASAFDMYATGEDYYKFGDKNTFILLENNLSGCGITERELFGSSLNARIHTVIRGIQDRDLWLFKYPDSKAYHTLLSKVPFSIEGWEKLFSSEDSVWDALLTEARATVSFIESSAHKAASKATMI